MFPSKGFSNEVPAVVSFPCCVSVPLATQCYGKLVMLIVFFAMITLQIRCIAIIAEGIPERLTQKLNKIARAKNVTIIGPATVFIVIIKF